MADAAAVVEQDTNSLILLIGTSLPDNMPEIRELSKIAPLHDVPKGLPSSLLERRPDILAAEHILKGAYANIGAARANFFPKIVITGLLGRMSSDYHNLWNGNAGTWNFLPQISLPIFDVEKNAARLELSEVEKELALTRYKKSIQNAFTEVADALIKREYISIKLHAQESLIAALKQSHHHATELYKAGLSDFINILDSERSLYNAKSELISFHLKRETNALMLYKSLGGGWDDNTD